MEGKAGPNVAWQGLAGNLQGTGSAPEGLAQTLHGAGREPDGNAMQEVCLVRFLQPCVRPVRLLQTARFLPRHGACMGGPDTMQKMCRKIRIVSGSVTLLLRWTPQSLRGMLPEGKQVVRQRNSGAGAGTATSLDSVRSGRTLRSAGTVRPGSLDGTAGTPGTAVSAPQSPCYFCTPFSVSCSEHGARYTLPAAQCSDVPLQRMGARI